MFKVSKTYSRKHERKRDDNFQLKSDQGAPSPNRTEHIEYSSVRNGRSPGPYGRSILEGDARGERSFAAERSFSNERAFNERSGVERSGSQGGLRRSISGDRYNAGYQAGFNAERGGYNAASERSGYNAERGYNVNDRAWHSSASQARSPAPPPHSPRSERGVYQADRGYWVTSPAPSRLSQRQHDTAYSAHHYNERQQREQRRQELREVARERYFKTAEPFHEKTEWETTEHYQRKVKRVKKPEAIKYVVREVKVSVLWCNKLF